MNKKEVLSELQRSRQQLVDVLDELSEEEMHIPGVCGEWAIKDILVHLMMWESELVKNLWQIQSGNTPTPTLTGSMTDHEQNEIWYQQFKDRPLERILPDFHGVRKQTIRRIEGFSDHDLTDPKRYPFLDGTPLWKRIAYDSFEHDTEHLNEIKDWLAKQDDNQ